MASDAPKKSPQPDSKKPAAEKKKAVTISVWPAEHEKYKLASSVRGFKSLSAYVESVMTQAVRVPPGEDPYVVGVPAGDSVVPVVLKIPRDLLKDRAEMVDWLADQCSRMVDQLAVE